MYSAIEKKKLIAKLAHKKANKKATHNFKAFIAQTKPDYVFNWHHIAIIEKLEAFIKGDNKKLMLFVPPQHGKSEIVSRRLPDWVLGMNPNTKIAACSYSSTLSSAFNRDVQRIIIGEGYDEIFPETTLNNSSGKSLAGSYLRNSEIFEVVDKKGFYKSTGVGGSLTGTTVDLGIIDDPVKDSVEANSKTYRDRIWNWYVDVFKSRLHNDSKQILLMTRWHEDDLAGRLLKHQSGEWEVVKYPAIATEDEIHRKKGDALWPERHSLEKLLETKRLKPSSFESLYQQNPTMDGGNIIKKDWIKTYRKSELPENLRVKGVFDLAYTDKEKNDPSGLMAYAVHDHNYYILDYINVRKTFPDLISFFPEFFRRNGIGIGYVENKGPGKSAVQTLRRETKLNVKEFKVGTMDKTSRLYNVIDYVEGGRVFLPEGEAFVQPFLESICAFPVATHDEEVDCLVMMLTKDGSRKKSFNIAS